MKWILAAPYLKKLEKSLWTVAMDIDTSLNFILSPSKYTHNRSRKQSSLKDWQDYWQHSADIWEKALENDCGMIAAFPQIPVCLGLRKRFSKNSSPIVAWTFNLGAINSNYKRKLAQYAVKTVNRFIVHSSTEVNTYSEYLGLHPNKFKFVPLHKPLMPISEKECQDKPFLLAMGSANRDYATLFKTIKKTGLPLTVVAPNHCLSGLSIPTSVTVKSNLSIFECRKLVQQARINIIPIDNEYTASGQVTAIEAMMYRRPVIATNTIGIKDYIVDGETGYLTASKSSGDLEKAIDALWNTKTLREAVAAKAQGFVKSELNHKKTASRLLKVLNDI